MTARALGQGQAQPQGRASPGNAPSVLPTVLVQTHY